VEVQVVVVVQLLVLEGVLHQDKDLLVDLGHQVQYLVEQVVVVLVQLAETLQLIMEVMEV
jgi:hypothetical protein